VQSGQRMSFIRFALVCWHGFAAGAGLVCGGLRCDVRVVVPPAPAPAAERGLPQSAVRRNASSASTIAAWTVQPAPAAYSANHMSSSGAMRTARGGCLCRSAATIHRLCWDNGFEHAVVRLG